LLVESRARVALSIRAKNLAEQKNLKRGAMPPDAVRFDSPDLARQIERLSQHQLDTLPFGVILIDRDGTIVFYSQTEAQQSGYGEIPLGQNLFEISPCMRSNDFQGRIKRAMDEGPVDLEFGWAGDFADPTRDLRLRVISSSNNGIWIFIERDSVSGAPPAA
jgi:photoactive yellow protein